jgi:hypothetical protein
LCRSGPGSAPGPSLLMSSAAGSQVSTDTYLTIFSAAVSLGLSPQSFGLPATRLFPSLCIQWLLSLATNAGIRSAPRRQLAPDVGHLHAGFRRLLCRNLFLYPLLRLPCLRSRKSINRFPIDALLHLLRQMNPASRG